MSDLLKVVGIISIAIIGIFIVKNIITKKRIAEEAKKKNQEAFSVKINKMYEKGEYTTIDIGLYDKSNQLIDRISLKSKEIDSDIHIGQVIHV